MMLALPSSMYAMSVEEMIEAAREGYGTVVESHSSASTGGQRASSGESVTTGDVSASSHTETYINANGSGGEVKVKTETTKNGVTETNEYSKKIEPGAGANVKANARATDKETSSEVNIDGKIMEAVATTNPAQAQLATNVTADIGAFFTTSVPSFFKKVFSFFW